MAGIGHLGVGLAAKRFMPKTPLAVLLLAPMLLDILWGGFSCAGIDPLVWSHGLFMSVVWSLIAAALTVIFTRDFNSGAIIGLLVFSHWVVDYVTHPMGFIFPKDTGIPIFLKGSPIVGLGYYNTLVGVIIGEAVLTIPGLIIYALTIKKPNNVKSKQLSR